MNKSPAGLKVKDMGRSACLVIKDGRTLVFRGKSKGYAIPHQGLNGLFHTAWSSNIIVGFEGYITSLPVEFLEREN